MMIRVYDVFNKRYFLMSIAMLWIMFYHAGFVVNNPIISGVKSIGYGGVDIFLLCSGYGCFCSLEKNSCILSFMHRRIARIMPTWLMFMMIWIPTMVVFHGMSLQAVIGNIFGIQTLTSLGDDFNWYISALWLLYFLSPYFHSVIKDNSLKHNIWFIVLLFILSIPFWYSSDLIICIARIPIYYIGMLFAKYRDKAITWHSVIAIMVCLIAGLCAILFFRHSFPLLLWDCALYWYPFIFITVGIVYILAQICMFLDKYCPSFEKKIMYIGKISLDVYLVHIFFFDIVNFLISKQFLPESNLIWVLAIIACIVLASALNKSVNYVTCKIETYVDKNSR